MIAAETSMVKVGESTGVPVGKLSVALLLKFVTLSTSVTPAIKVGLVVRGLSVNAVRSGTAGAVGAVVSIWTVRAALNAPTLPAASTARDVYW